MLLKTHIPRNLCGTDKDFDVYCIHNIKLPVLCKIHLSDVSRAYSTS